jgi:hypothetical protein
MSRRVGDGWVTAGSDDDDDDVLLMNAVVARVLDFVRWIFHVRL